MNGPFSDLVYIYVLGTDKAPQKIGFSSSPASRARFLAPGNADEFSVDFSGPVPRKDAHQIERLIHSRLADKHVRGEWFDVGPSDGIAAVRAGIKDYADGHRAPQKERAKRCTVPFLTTAAWIADVDNWRAQQPDIPNRSDAIRRLVESGLAKEKEKPRRS